MIYFWSDTHFNHTNSISYCKRPYKGVHEMNMALVDRWNSAVGLSDTIFLLGDFAYPAGSEGLPLDGLFSMLNGFKYLVKGNHDYKNKEVFKLPWVGQFDLKEVKLNHRKVVCCHYPLESWSSAHHGNLHAHGHSHGSLRRKLPHRFDVGVDVLEKPISFEELWALGNGQTFDPTDHHAKDL